MSDETEYERGMTAGRIDARLAGHDKHFSEINGSIKDLVHEVHQVVLGQQRLELQFKSAAETVVTTAAALKDAEEARRGKSEQSWTPVQRLMAVVGTLVGVGLLIASSAAIYLTTRPTHP